ncbi:unnamed protein product [Larinioides sclopetarius]|uniref:PABS domain-containing protein n=1 Tax=Larinioides sclopetarius TaxID=280406 RepID=A0AAV2APQ3_9ARAC
MSSKFGISTSTFGIKSFASFIENCLLPNNCFGQNFVFCSFYPFCYIMSTIKSILADYNVPTTTKFGLDSFKKGWYTETGTNAGDQAMSVKVEKILYQGKSKYQDIVVFESAKWGRVLALDNAVQLTEMDEFSWQEMATYLPLNSHPNPKKVLVIGGGDGGTVRDITKHPLVESVTMCEIDETVIEMSKKYLPFMAKGFDSPKLTLHIGDGVEFMKNHQNEFDVIITDSTDPKGRKQ